MGSHTRRQPRVARSLSLRVAFVFLLTLFALPAVTEAASFTRAQAPVFSTYADPATASYGSTPTEGNLLVVIAGERGGGSAANFTISGSGWTKIIADTTEQADSNARRTMVVWYKVAGASEPTSITVDDGTTASKQMLLQEFTADAEVTWSFLATTTGNTGTGSASPVGSGSTVSVSGDMFLVGTGLWRNQAATVPSSVAFSGLASVQNSTGGSNQLSIASAMGSSTAAGTKSTSLSWAGAGLEGNAGLMVFAAEAVDPTPVWNPTDWTLYDTITIDSANIDEDLTNFPVYVDLSDLSSQFWSTTPSASTTVGTDIRVTTASNTELPRELVFASSTLQTGELHFEADSISSTTDTVFKIWYNGTTTGDYATTSTYGAQNVWGNGYEIVAHLQQDPSGGADAVFDSTKYNNHGTSFGSMTTSDLVADKLGYAYDFDGIGDRIDFQNVSYASAPLTFSAWARIDATSSASRIIDKTDSAPDQAYSVTVSFDDVEFAIDNYAGYAPYTDPSYGDDNWHYYVGTTDSSDLYGFFDGAEVASSTHDNTWNETAAEWSIGALNFNGGEAWDGRIDEFRVSSSTRSAAWISAEYTNQSTTTDFYTAEAYVAPLPTGIDVVGTLYESDGVTVITDVVTIGAAVGTSTVSVHSTTTDGSGNFSLKVGTSSIGVWSSSSAEANSWQEIAYGNGRFVAVSGDGANRVTYSDDGITWIPASASAVTGWNDVVYGKNMFVAVGGLNGVMYSRDGINWTNANAADSGIYNEIAYGNGRFVALSTNATNKVMYSEDGINWTAATASLSGSYVGLEYGNGRFVALLQNGATSAMYSDDGINWTTSNDLEPRTWYSLAYGDGRYVATGGGCTANSSCISYSDDGINWNPASSTDNTNWTGAVYGNGYFVALAPIGGGDRIMYSEDGINWTSASAPETSTWFTAGFGAGRFVALATGGTHRAMYADAGFGEGTPITLFVDSPSATTSATTITYGINNDSGTTTLEADLIADTVLLKKATNTPELWLSHANQPDSEADSDILFTATTSTTTINADVLVNASTTVYAPQNLELYGDFTQNGEWRGENGTTYFYGPESRVSGTLSATSSLADTVWSPRPLASGTFERTLLADDELDDWRDVTYGNGTFVAVTSSGNDNAADAAVIYSTDGLSWATTSALGDDDYWTTVTYGEGLFVALGNDTGAMTSPDGITWTARSFSSDNDDWSDVTYGNGTFVAVGNCALGNCVATSDDGTSWTTRTPAESNNWYGVTYGDGQFVAVSINGTNRVMTSPDGVTWTSRSILGNDDSWRGVAYGDGYFVAAGASTPQSLARSDDGITWTEVTGITQDTGYVEIEYVDGQFIIWESSTGAQGFFSTNGGQTWATTTFNKGSGGGTTAKGGFAAGDNIIVAVWGLSSVFYLTGNATIESLASTSDFVLETGLVTADSALTVSGDFMNYDRYMSQSATYFTGVSSTLTAQAGAGADPYIGAVEIIGSSTLGSAAEVDTLTVVSGGELRLDDNAVALYGDFTQNGSLDAGTGILEVRGAGVNLFGTMTGTSALPDIALSPNLEWNLTSNFPDTVAATDLTYGTGTLVAVGLCSDLFAPGFDCVAYSTDNGVTWATSSATGEGSYWANVEYGAEDDLFVAVGYSNAFLPGADTVMTSPDGITWTARSAAGDNDIWNLLEYGGGTFVALEFGLGDDIAMYSTDGITWATTTAAGDDDSWRGLTYGEGKFVAVAGSFTSNDKIMYSTDGITWATTTAAGDDDDGWRDIAFGGGTFVAVGDCVNEVDCVMYSDDAITWATTSPADARSTIWQTVNFAGEYFIAEADCDEYEYCRMYSKNGADWSVSRAREQLFIVTNTEDILVSLTSSDTFEAITFATSSVDDLTVTLGAAASATDMTINHGTLSFANDFTINGNLSNSDTVLNTGELLLDGGSSVVAAQVVSSADPSLGDVSILGTVIASGSASTSDLTIVSGGDFTAPSTSITVAGTFAQNGSFDANGGTIYFEDVSTLSGLLTDSNALAAAIFTGGQSSFLFGTSGVVTITNTSDANTPTSIAGDENYLYVTGFCSGDNCDGGVNSAIYTAAVDKVTGEVAWATTTDPSVGSDRGSGIAVDEDYVYVTGYCTGCGNQGSRAVYTFAIDKTNGDMVWSTTTDRTTNQDYGESVYVDETGLYVTGTCVDCPSGIDIYTIAIDKTNGDFVWDTLTNPTGSAYGRDIVGDDDNVYVTGNCVSCDGHARYTLALDKGTGSQVWATTSNTSVFADIPYAMEIDAGTLYITGECTGNLCDGGSGYAFFTNALSAADGSPIWVATSSPGNSEDEARGIAVADGVVYVTGWCESCSTGYSYAYQQSDGSLIWGRESDGPQYFPLDSLVDSGRIYAVGLGSSTYQIMAFDTGNGYFLSGDAKATIIDAASTTLSFSLLGASSTVTAEDDITVGANLENEGALTLQGDFNVIGGDLNSTGTLSVSNGTTTFGGSYTNAGTADVESVVAVFSGSGESINGVATGSSAFGEMRFSGSYTANTEISAEDLTIESGGSLVAPAQLSLSGNYQNDGTFDANSGTVSLIANKFSANNLTYVTSSTTVAAVATAAYGFDIANDGSSVYVLDAFNAQVTEYSLTTAWDISSASYVAATSSASGTFSGGATAVRVSEDGTKMYLLSAYSGLVNEYDLTTPWDITTASYNTLHTFTEVGNLGGLVYSFHLTEDGANAYFTSGDGSVPAAVLEYDIQTPGDLSTASATALLDLSEDMTDIPVSIAFNEVGTSMVLLGFNGASLTLNEFSLATPFRINSASLSEIYAMPAETAFGIELEIGDNDRRAYIYDASADEIDEYSVNARQQTLSGDMVGASAFAELEKSGDATLVFTASASTTGTFTIASTSAAATATTTVFAAGQTYTFENIDWQGADASTTASLRSSASGTVWYLDVSGTQTNVDYLFVQDSDASIGPEIIASNSTDGGNNTNWNFGAGGAGATGVTITGTLYKNDGITPIGAGKLIVAAVGTSTPSLHSTTTDASSNYSIEGIATSSLGAWSAVSAAGDNDSWVGLTYGNGRFVAVGGAGDHRVMYSDDGVTWNTTSAAGDDDSWVAAAYGSGRFVAVGQSGDRVMYSDDGVIWATTSAAGDDENWTSVAYGEGLFVAVSRTGDRVMTSPDGITWTVRSAAGNNDAWWEVAYGNGRFVAVSDLGDRAMYSDDGISWTVSSLAGGDDSWYGVTYGNGRFVAVGGGTTDRVAYSVDGATWSTSTIAGDDETWNDIVYANGRFIAAGSFAGAGSDRIAYSTDGITWTTQTAAGDNDVWLRIVYGAGKLVAVGNSGDRVMYADAGFGEDTPITLFVDENATTSSTTANTLTYGLNSDAGATTITANLYADTLMLQKLQVGSSTNEIWLADADAYDSEGDSDVLFIATTSTTTVNADLRIASGTTVFAPQHLVIDGDFYNYGTFYAERGEVVADATAYDALDVNYETYFNFSANQSGQSFTAAISNDGRYYFVGNNTSDEIDQYTLNIPYSIATASYLTATSLTAYVDTPAGLDFSPDGSRMYVLDQVDSVVHQFDLSTPWDVTTSGYVAEMSVTGNQAIVLSPAGDKLLTHSSSLIREYNLSIPWDITSLSSTGNTHSVPAGNSYGMDASLDGTTIAHSLNGTPDLLYKVTLASPWDLSSVSATGSIQLNNEISGAIGEVSFAQDGGKLYLTQYISNRVHEYTLDQNQHFTGNFSATSSLWDLTIGDTATVSPAATTEVDNNYHVGGSAAGPYAGLIELTSTSTLSGTGNFGFVEIQGTASSTETEATFTDLTIASGGDFIAPAYGTLTITGDFDPSAGSFDVATATTYFGGQGTYNALNLQYLGVYSVNSDTPEITNLTFSSDGKKLYIIDGGANDQIDEYTLTTPWDMTTATYEQATSTAAYVTSSWGISFNPEGTLLFQANSTDDSITQYTLSTPWDISTTDFLASTSIATNTSEPYGMNFKPDGTVMTIGDGTTRIDQYALASPWDVTTLSFVGDYDPTVLQAFRDHAISPNGKYVAVVGNGFGNNDIDLYTLGTPWDITTGSYAGSVTPFENGTTIEFSSDGRKLFTGQSGPDTVYSYDVTALVGTSTAGNALANVIFSASGTSAFTGPASTTDFTINSNATVTAPTTLTVAGDYDNFGQFENNSGAVNFTGETGSYHSYWTYLNASSTFSESFSQGGYHVSEDGTTLIVPGEYSDIVYEYAFGTPYDVTTLSFTASTSLDASATDKTDGTVTNDGRYLFSSHTNYSDAVEVWQYEFGTPNDISTLSFVASTSFAVPGEGYVTAQLSVDGTQLFATFSAVGVAEPSLNQYALTTPFDVSSAVFVASTSAINIGGIGNLHFELSPDGRYLIQPQYTYEFATPFDVSTLTLVQTNECCADGDAIDTIEFADGGTRAFGFGNTEVYALSLNSVVGGALTASSALASVNSTGSVFVRSEFTFGTTNILGGTTTYAAVGTTSDLAVASGAVFEPGSVLAVDGDLTNNGQFTSGIGTVRLIGGSANLTGDFVGDNALANTEVTGSYTFSSPASTTALTIASGGDLTANSPLSVVTSFQNAGTYDAPSEMSLYGSYENTGSADHSSSLLEIQSYLQGYLTGREAGTSTDGERVTALASAGDTLYVGRLNDIGTCVESTGEYCEILIFDVSSTTNPILIGGRQAGIAFSSRDVFEMLVEDSTLYVGLGIYSGACNTGTGESCELLVFDISSTTNPIFQTGRESASGVDGQTVQSLAVASSTLYVGTSLNFGSCNTTTGQNCELIVYDITTPNNPVFITARENDDTTVGDSVNFMTSKGVGLYLASDFNVRVFDIASATNPIDVRTVSFGGTQYGAAVKGDSLYVVGFSLGVCVPSTGASCNFRIYDVSSSTNPIYVTGFDTPGESNADGLRVLNDSLFVHDGSSSGGSVTCNPGTGEGCELLVYDISSTTQPVYRTGRDGDFETIHDQDHVLYVGGGTNTAGGTEACVPGTGENCELTAYDLEAYISGDMVGTNAFADMSVETGFVRFTDSASTTGTMTANESTLTFNAGASYTFQNIDWQGSGTTSELVLRSSASGTEWYLDVPGSQLNVEFVNVQDSNASYGTGNTILATDSTDSGNNTNWSFGAEEWNATDWTLYDLITIKHEAVDETLVDFPVYVDLADLSPQFWSTTPAGATFTGTDIRITTDETNPQELPRELVFASSTLETGELHFKADRISDVIDTSFRIYYNGNTDGDYADDATYGQYNVWSNGYVGVWHFNDGPTGSAGDTTDSTQYQNHGTSTGDSVTQIGARLGYGYDLSGFSSQEHVVVPDDATFDFSATPYSTTMWVNLDATQTIYSALYTKGDPAGTNDFALQQFSGGGVMRSYNANDTEILDYDAGSFDDITGTGWQFITLNYDGSTSSLAANTISKGSGAIGAPTYTTDRLLRLAGTRDASSRTLDGIIDEYRFATTTRSDAWMSAEYTNQSTTTDFYYLSSGTGSSTLSDHDATQTNNAFSYQNVTDGELFTFKLTPESGSATVTEVTLVLRGAKDIDVNDFSDFRLYEDVDNDGIVSGGCCDAPVTLGAVMTLGNEGIRSNNQQGTIVFSGDFLLSAATNYIVTADWNAPENGSSLTIDLLASGIIAYDADGGHTIYGSVDHVQHNRHNKGGGGGTSAQVGGPPPVGDGDVGGGTNEGGELIGNDPDFNLPAGGGFNAGLNWSNIANVYDGTDGTYGSTAAGVNAEYLGSFNHGVPGTDSITGIEVKLEVSGTTAAGEIGVELSWDSGASFTSTGYTTGTLTTTDTVVTLGGPSDTWGRSWSPSELSNSSFELRIVGTPSSNTVQIDAIQVKIYHQATGGGGGGGGAI